MEKSHRVGKSRVDIVPPLMKIKILSTRPRMICFGSSGGAEAAARKTCHPVPGHSTCFEWYRMYTDRHWLHQ